MGINRPIAISWRKKALKSSRWAWVQSNGAASKAGTEGRDNWKDLEKIHASSLFYQVQAAGKPAAGKP